MRNEIKFEKGDIVFVVEVDNTYIGTVTGKTMPVDMVEIEPMYMKRIVKTTSMWTEQKNIQSYFGTDKKAVLTEYAEYFI